MPAGLGDGRAARVALSVGRAEPPPPSSPGWATPGKRGDRGTVAAHPALQARRPGPHGGSRPSVPREPVVPPGGHAQLPAGLQLGARVQQRAPRVRGAPGPGLGPAWGGVGGERGWGAGFPLESPLPPPGITAEGQAFSQSVFQVWVIANKVQGSHSLSRGTVCHRTGVRPLEPKGQGWDYGIGVSGRVRRPRGPGPGVELVGGPGRVPRGSLSLWKDGLCPLTPSSLLTCPSPSRGAGITSAFGPMLPEPPGVHPRRGLASRASPTGPRWRPGPRGKPWAPSAAEASSHLEQPWCPV